MRNPGNVEEYTPQVRWKKYTPQGWGNLGPLVGVRWPAENRHETLQNSFPRGVYFCGSLSPLHIHGVFCVGKVKIYTPPPRGKKKGNVAKRFPARFPQGFPQAFPRNWVGRVCLVVAGLFWVDLGGLMLGLVGVMWLWLGCPGSAWRVLACADWDCLVWRRLG